MREQLIIGWGRGWVRRWVGPDLTNSNSVSVQFSHSLQSQSAQGGTKPSLPVVIGESRQGSLPPWIWAMVFIVTIFNLGGSLDAIDPTLECCLSGRDPDRTYRRSVVEAERGRVLGWSAIVNVNVLLLNHVTCSWFSFHRVCMTVS